MLENLMSASLVDRFAAARVLCVGDIMLDRFIYGDASRLSPEAPIPVIRQTHELETLGGVGNAARNLRDLGAEVSIIALTGLDIAASHIRNLMAECGMDDSGLLVDPSRRTTEKTRIIARQQQMLRLDAEHTTAISKDIETSICARITTDLPQCHAVILSDYGKGLLTPAIIAHVIKQAKKVGIPVLVDPKGADYSIYKGATLVTPNLSELTQACGGAPLETDEAIVRAAQGLIKSCDLQAVVATRSKDGMSVVEKDKGKITHWPTRAREVFDVSGAGDTVIAVLALGLAIKLPLNEAAYIANAAAGVVVGKLGTATLTPAELATALSVKTGGDTSKIMTWAQAEAMAAEWRTRGLRVVTTNGVFDILHEGHVTLLEQAKAQGDRLMVLINADASVKRLKGDTRPVNTQESRARVLAALAAADAVAIFGSDADEKDMPLKLLDILKPDIHVKGGDYKIESLPETAVVRRHGGEVVIVPLVDGASTTGTIARMRA